MQNPLVLMKYGCHSIVSIIVVYIGVRFFKKCVLNKSASFFESYTRMILLAEGWVFESMPRQTLSRKIR